MSYDLTSFEKAMALFANRVGIIVNLEVGDKMTPEDAYQKIKNISEYINDIGTGDTTCCKIEYNERDLYFISMTKKRYDTAKGKDINYMKNFNIKQQTTNCSVKLTNDEISKSSNIIENMEKDIITYVGKYYKEFVLDFLNKYEKHIDNLIKNIIEIDISCCNAKNAFEYRYNRPNISNESDENDTSFVKMKNMRHPIVERIIEDVEYIGNDIELSTTDRNGKLLYGINSSGKSTLMKSVGLNIIMAQSGMYVAASTMIFNPYKHIFTRISGMDNIYKGMSSFVVEMTELRNILQRCDKNSLVLGDEICCGTEATSALAIVAAGIETLVNKKTGFIFATHLHELTELKQMRQLIEYDKCISVYHIHISIDEKNVITFHRKLKEGKGLDTYGIEVCKSLNMPSNFMKTAEDIRKEINGLNSLIVNSVSSKYNNELYMTECNICGRKAHDTHHIKYQSDSDENGFFENHHKNIKHNLIALCKDCHNKEHNGTIKIKGYKTTTEGIVIDVDNGIDKEEESYKVEYDYKKLLQYIKRGKCNQWYVRNVKTNIFRKCDEITVIKKINKMLNTSISNIQDDLSDQLFDPTM